MTEITSYDSLRDPEANEHALRLFEATVAAQELSAYFRHTMVGPDYERLVTELRAVLDEKGYRVPTENTQISNPITVLNTFRCRYDRPWGKSMVSAISACSGLIDLTTDSGTDSPSE
ncbi:hypothetical protein M231_04793 [Tremella mesenterica]|uniref:Uncharacterized protein n=1 Tax=Tremella mesenterica TaxID=5217 RepID=A0A4Q1BJL8_TREME|nr:uncharacterized protein TREMEDRAFT_64433 [Tremella mesenterica DSM 1558]EIW67193.1 hypothetical protein TREMEDRAFT_64433 [Tremella mesenterica DSM 1558]RXK37904.1 hypothetical protein M231_04793 [Tremella mesenterica]